MHANKERTKEKKVEWNISINWQPILESFLMICLLWKIKALWWKTLWKKSARKIKKINLISIFWLPTPSFFLKGK